MLAGTYVTTNDLIGLASDPFHKRRVHRATGGLSGSLASRVRGRGVDLDEVRPYQPGDDVRNIDWKVTARKQKVHTKIFREERERPTMVIVDQSRSMFFGSEVRLKSVAAAEIAARIAWQTLGKRDRVGGMVMGSSSPRVLKPVRSKLNVVRLLQAISDANNELNASRQEQETDRSWHKALENLRRVTSIGHRLVFISDFVDISSSELDELLVLKNHNEVSLVHIFDQLEQKLPPRGTYTVSDGLSNVTFSTGRAQQATRYTNRFKSHQDELLNACQKRGVRFQSVSTVDDPTEVLMYE